MPIDKIFGFMSHKHAMKDIDDIGNIAAENILAYGVQWNNLTSGSACIRIGNPALHISLPIQTAIRRCIVDDVGTVKYYLNPDNSLLKVNGQPADLSGNDGQVMVEIPQYYAKFSTDGDIHRLMISQYALSGYTIIPKLYIGAFEASLQRSTLKLASVINSGIDFRGGNNNALWDAQPNTLLGKPVTSINLTNFRTYARNRGARWHVHPYIHYHSLRWLFIVEFANRNSQLPINSTLTVEGYRQGGLGDGPTTVSSPNWNTFSNYYPIIPCGITTSLGNKTGEVNYNVIGFTGGDINVKVNSYRGIEMPFGHIWEFIDGVLFDIQAIDAGNESKIYICDLPQNFADTITSNYRQIGLLPRNESWITKVNWNEGCLLPSTVSGGSNVTFFCDNNYTNLPGSLSSVRALLSGGAAHTTTDAGLFTAYSNSGPSAATARFGSRLCFL